jgi:hypothetical protein
MGLSGSAGRCSTGIHQAVLGGALLWFPSLQNRTEEIEA